MSSQITTVLGSSTFQLPPVDLYRKVRIHHALQVQKGVRELRILGLILVATAAVASPISYNAFRSFRSMVDSNRQVDVGEKELSQMQKQTAELSNAVNRWTTYQTFRVRRNAWAMVIGYIGTSAPASVTLDRVTMDAASDREKLSITGFALSVDAFREYHRRLEQIRLIGEVRVLEVAAHPAAGPEGIRFHLEADGKGGLVELK